MVVAAGYLEIWVSVGVDHQTWVLESVGHLETWVAAGADRWETWVSVGVGLLGIWVSAGVGLLKIWVSVGVGRLVGDTIGGLVAGVAVIQL